MDADHKTVKRLLDSMISRGMLCAPITVDVPVAKSRYTLCRSRPVRVYCGPERKVPDAAHLCSLNIGENTIAMTLLQCPAAVRLS